MKKILVFVIFMILPLSIKAISYRGCDTSEIARMKALVNNINISYDYQMNDSPIFTITINNLTSDIYFVDSRNNNEYHYSDSNNGEISIGGYGSGDSGRYKFYADKNDCYKLNLGSKYYSLPSYNYYYNDPLCDGLDINLCNRWGSNSYSRAEFENLINEYLNSKKEYVDEDITHTKTLIDVIMEFYIKYYIYILLSIILICSLIIFIDRKKNRFNI